MEGQCTRSLRIKNGFSSLLSLARDKMVIMHNDIQADSAAEGDALHVCSLISFVKKMVDVAD
jgi:hypothetical protein